MSQILNPIAALLKENQSVKFLSFRNMNLEQLPVDLSAFPNLEHLDLRGNKFLKLPKQILKLKKLKQLNLSKNKSLNWSDALLKLSELPRLVKLNMANCNLASIPAELYHFDHLEELILDDNLFNPLSDRNAMNLPEGIKSISVLNCNVDYVSNRTKALKHLQNLHTTIFDYEIIQKLHYLLPSTTFLLR